MFCSSVIDELVRPHHAFLLLCLHLLAQSLLVCCDKDAFCHPILIQPRAHRDGDLLLDGFFPLYSVNVHSELQQLSFLLKPGQDSPNKWYWKNYQYVLSFLFAIEKINTSPQLLPNLTLGFNLYNALTGEHKTLESVLFWFSGGTQYVPNYNCPEQKKSVAIIAGTTTEFSADIESLLELYRIPQITYGPFDPFLSEKEKFPSLYQMASKDTSLVQGVISLLHHFGWTHVNIFVSEDMKGEQFFSHLEAEMLKKDLCIASIRKLPVTWIKGTKSFSFTNYFSRSYLNKVCVIGGDAESFINQYIEEAFSYLLGNVWIMAIKWYVDFVKMIDYISLFHGSLSFSHPMREIPGFKEFLKAVNPLNYPEDFFFNKLWFDTFDCSFQRPICGKFKVCSHNASLEFIPPNINMLSISESSYLIHKAVYVLAQVLHEMLLTKTEMVSVADGGKSELFSWQLHPFLRNIPFTDPSGDHMFLDDNSKSLEQYDILNTVELHPDQVLLVKIGEFIFSGPDNQSLVINADMIKWPHFIKETPQSVCSQKCGPGFKKVKVGSSANCCYDCALCPMWEVSNQTDAQQCMKCSVEEYPNQERTHCLSRDVTFLSFKDSSGLILTCIALCFSILTAGIWWVFVKHQDTPIVKANNPTLSRILLISLLLCFLCSFLFIGRPHTATCILQQVTFAVVFTVAVSTVLAKTITVFLAFKAINPRRTMRWLLVSGAANLVIPLCTVVQVIICGLWLGLSPPFVDLDTHSEPRYIIILCNKGSVTAFYCVLGYLGSLALVSFSLSYLVRNLPDTFNEAKFLTFSMLVFCSIWVTFLPVYHSAQGKVMVILEIFSILASSAGLLVCIFAPKCYIILIRPNKNSLRGIRHKTSYSRNTHS